MDESRTGSESRELALAKHQRFEVKRMSRRELKGAPYNPRKIDTYARQKLRENLTKVGLLQPLVVNKRTGNLVSGHQRLALLDAIEGVPEYLLDVAVVDLDEKQEREQLVFMNNAAAMGTWDVAELEKLVRDAAGFDWRKAGFDQLDIETLFPELSRMFNPEHAPPEVKNYLADAVEFADAARAAAKEERAAAQNEVPAAAGASAAVPIPDPHPGASDGLQGVIERRKAYQEKRALINTDEFYCVVVFPTKDHKEDFLRELKLSPNDTYVDGVRLANAMGIRMMVG